MEPNSELEAAVAHGQAADKEIERLRAALQQMADLHIGDQPAAYNDDDAWARRCHGELRMIARNALKE